MASFYRKVLLFITILSISNFVHSQTSEIKIKFIGNCGLYLTDGKSNLYIDFPYKSGAHNYMKYDATEIENIKENSIFLFTHRHADHYSKKAIRQVKSKHLGRVFGNWNTDNFGTLSGAIDDFKIEVFKTKHRFTFKHYSYLITWHGKRIFLSGDTESAKTISSVKDIDWAFVPTWIISDAKENNLKIEAEKIGVYHLYPNQKITNSAPNKYFLMDKQGEEIIIQY